MELSCEEISGAAPAMPAGPVWDEAFLRVESYLRAHHLESRVLLNRITTEIIRDAWQHSLANPGEEPVAIAMRCTHARIGAWFSRAGNHGDWSDERVRARGRLALVLKDLPGNSTSCFLSNDPIPAELPAILASGILLPGPELHLSNMSAAPLEFGFDEPSDPSTTKKSGWSTVREAAGWIALVGIYGAAWAASH
ncbi:MAG TPA: hypothetical protein VGM64_11235 [Lacunisphaera sp.]|jgi:hypothetical protein